MVMKFIFSSICLVFFFITNAQEALNIMSFNIRLNTPSDSLNAWPYRKDKVISQILFHEAHILGVQEALHDQMMDLQTGLSKYRFAGVGRDDGKQKGEYSAIFYDTTRLSLMQSSTFWLSETPTVPGSKSWDAAITRIVSWTKFIDKITKKTFFVFNTHFDHIGEVARKESALLLKKEVNAIAGSSPVIITGDFNSKSSDEPIRVLLDKKDPLHFIDSKEISLSAHYGPTGTFNAFQDKETDTLPIDYIFVKKKISVWKHATLSQTWQGRFSSDHFPVFVKLHLD
jgi:endonuclease/exonuclease/phosphatase family metal-dependent hydrolase